MKKVLIIGGDSYIAGKFIEKFNSIYRFELISRKKTGIQHEYIYTDFFTISEQHFMETNIVINFAAIVHKPQINDINLYKLINTDLVVSLAEKSMKHNVEHFIQMSTIAVYGDQKIIKVNSCTKPTNMYGKSKFDADNYLLSLKHSSMSSSIIRPPMVYGGGLAPGNLLKLIQLAQKGIPLPLKGIQNSRDFIHVDNLINAINIIIQKKLTGVYIPTDLNSISTEKLISTIGFYSEKTVRYFKIPKIIKKIIKTLNKSLFNKLYGDLIVECNMPIHDYHPIANIEFGIQEMIKSLK